MTPPAPQPRHQPASPELSVVVPFFNEVENVATLHEEIAATAGATGRSYELVYIDDGSKDGTDAALATIAAGDPRVRVVSLLRNYGQTAAMMAGFDHATGAIIVTMDGDGQNDPAEIPRLLDELEKGYDVVSGWRIDRQDRTVTRTLPSKAANWLISRVSGVALHDYGCSLKAYRRDIMRGVRLYGEMHRFIPIYAAWQGGRIAELPVAHRPRLHGQSKYGLNRIYKVLLDLLLVAFMERYLTKPIYVFGGLGLLSLLLSFCTAVWAVWLKVVDGVFFTKTPLPILTGTFFTTGVLCVLMGLLAELMVRTYYEAQSKSVYQVRDRKNIDAP